MLLFVVKVLVVVGLLLWWLDLPESGTTFFSCLLTLMMPLDQF